MSTSLIFAAIWAIIATVTALLPMRWQFAPGVTLLALAPVLIGYIGVQHGFWVAGLGLLAFLSMFRNPLIYIFKKSMGMPVTLPKELQGGKQ
ncbi:MAG: DUF2484 family protein [Paracoccaceae bacterium]